MDVDRQDAFSRTLESRPRQRASLAHSQSRARTVAFSHGGENAVDRLSRVFEQDRRSSADIVPPVTTTAAPKRPPPPPPTKPPSLRATTYTNRPHDPLPSPSSESLISPSSTGTVATSVTSYASDVQSHIRSSKETEENFPEQKEHNSNVDETSLAFQDIRARFQQKENAQPLPFPKRPESTYIRNSKSDYSKPPTSIPAKPLVRPPRPSPIETINNNNNVIDSDTPQVPRSGSFVAELSKRIEHNVDDESSHKLPTRRISSSPRSSVHRKPSNRTADSRPPPITSKKPSMANLNSPSNSGLHLPFIARTGTGNSTVSTSSATSSLATTESASKRAWHYGAALANWLSGHDHNQQHPSSTSSPSLKDSIVVTSREPITPATEDRPVSGTDTVTSCTTTTSLPISPQPSGKPHEKASRKVKRAKVIKELIDTERSYQNDMVVVKEVYYDHACTSTSPLDKSDVKTLFSNLLDITQFEDEFVSRLTQATCVDHSDDNDDDEVSDGTTVGLAFREMMEQIDAIYCEYCKNHEDAVLRLQELENRPDTQPFFDECRIQMQGLTASWDLGSLLIKPVQRVLKYPLLLREIFLLTPTDHPDHDDLAAATQEIQQVADHINEIKRRKDIVEKIVGDKKKNDINVVHGINKKLTRRAQQFKQATGFSAEATQDALFDALYLQFEEQQEIARQLARDIQGWVRQVKNHFENLRVLAESLESLYGSWGGVRVKSLQGFQDFTKSTAMYSSAMTRELDTKVQSYVYPRIDEFLKVFDNPMQVIRKRAQKLLDYDRVRDIKSKGDTPDKTLQESADAYVSINAQLVDELPRFFKLTAKYFDILVGDLANVQHQFYCQMAREWQKLLDRHLSRN